MICGVCCSQLVSPSPKARDLVWEFVQEKWDWLKERYQGSFLLGRVVEVCERQGREREKQGSGSICISEEKAETLKEQPPKGGVGLNDTPNHSSYVGSFL